MIPMPVVDTRGPLLLAAEIRRNVVRMCAGRGQGYAGQGLALADILGHLYGRALRDDTAEHHDRVVLSTGHSAIGLFAALGALGVYELDELRTYGQDGSRIEESPLEGSPGFEITGGALGHGLSQAVGLALGERAHGRGGTIYCLVSDGELQEGQVWEAAMAAGHHRLGNLVLLVDNNGMQADGATAEVMDIEPVPQKLASFGFESYRIDPHDHDVLTARLPTGGRRSAVGRPLGLVCQTVPGMGSAAVEALDKVHYVRASADFWAQSLADIDAPPQGPRSTSTLTSTTTLTSTLTERG